MYTILLLSILSCDGSNSFLKNVALRFECLSIVLPLKGQKKRKGPQCFCNLLLGRSFIWMWLSYQNAHRLKNVFSVEVIREVDVSLFKENKMCYKLQKDF